MHIFQSFDLIVLDTLNSALLIGTSDFVLVADAASRFILNDNTISLPISVKAMDIDVKERKLYWISNEDGVREESDREHSMLFSSHS